MGDANLYKKAINYLMLECIIMRKSHNIFIYNKRKLLIISS